MEASGWNRPPTRELTVQTLSTSSGYASDPRRDVGEVAGSPIRPFSRPGSRDYRSRLPVAPNPNLPYREEGAVIASLDSYMEKPYSTTTPPPSASEKPAEFELEMVTTEDGVPIDFTALERGGDDVFAVELKRRTAGMEGREELFRFIEGLNGEWVNRKRMCVDAKEFSDVLPAGWKVVVALKPSREGRTVPYFYRYLSPSGEQFPSCKEVAKFLQTHFLSRPTHQNVAVLREEDDDGGNCTAIVPYQAVYEEDDGVNWTAMGPYDHEAAALREEEEEDGVPYTAPETHGEEILSDGTDNPVDIQIHGQYQCRICETWFHERPEFARHRKFHRKTPSGYRTRSPLTDGVIMKDGKYGCQFCPKVFDRKISYTGHVGIHLRRNVKCSTTANMVAETSGSVEVAPMAPKTYYGKDPRTGVRHGAFDSRDEYGSANLRLLCEAIVRNNEEDDELANLKLLSEVSTRDELTNLRLLCDVTARDEDDDELVNLRLLSEVSERRLS